MRDKRLETGQHRFLPGITTADGREQWQAGGGLIEEFTVIRMDYRLHQRQRWMCRQSPQTTSDDWLSAKRAILFRQAGACPYSPTRGDNHRSSLFSARFRFHGLDVAGSPRGGNCFHSGIIPSQHGFIIALQHLLCGKELAKLYAAIQYAYLYGKYAADYRVQRR
jgi:hypothetical protein